MYLNHVFYLIGFLTFICYTVVCTCLQRYGILVSNDLEDNQYKLQSRNIIVYNTITTEPSSNFVIIHQNIFKNPTTSNENICNDIDIYSEVKLYRGKDVLCIKKYILGQSSNYLFPLKRQKTMLKVNRIIFFIEIKKMKWPKSR